MSSELSPKEKEYISLAEAAKLCQYSQEYLSLRARQGKLKAVKIGRNWITKKEWLEEYLRKIEEYDNRFKKVEPYTKKVRKSDC
jgi:excisionase family DNA binding protein